jgi:hypothetical protein
MTPENFCYWLQGYFELQLKVGGDAHNVLSSLQVQQIRDHLNLVFKKETPNRTFNWEEATKNIIAHTSCSASC